MTNARSGATRIVADSVSSFLETFTFGDEVTKEWLVLALDVRFPDVGRLVDFNRAQTDFVRAFEQMRSVLLLDHQMALRSLNDGVWEVVPSAEQARYAVDRAAKRVAKEVEASARIADNTRIENLSADEASQHRMSAAKLSAFADLVHGGLRDLRKAR